MNEDNPLLIEHDTISYRREKNNGKEYFKVYTMAEDLNIQYNKEF